MNVTSFMDDPLPVLLFSQEKKTNLTKVTFFYSPLGLVPEVPLLQAFENDVGRGWTRFVVAGLAVICLNITLLELSLPLHSLVSSR